MIKREICVVSPDIDMLNL